MPPGIVVVAALGGLGPGLGKSLTPVRHRPAGRPNVVVPINGPECNGVCAEFLEKVLALAGPGEPARFISVFFQPAIVVDSRVA